VSTAEYQRRWRASKGARTGQPGRPATEPCGTASTYKRHKRRGEDVDTACREAYNAEQRRLYRQRKSTGQGV
jgi:hypothetical protein